MAQITSGIRKIFNNPLVYDLFQNAVGARKRRKKLISEYFQLKPGMKVLEIGCGPGVFSEHFGHDIYFTGIDLSKSYIDYAKKRYAHKKNQQFICEDVNHFVLTSSAGFDLVYMVGLLHHLEDEECSKVFKTAYEALKPGGRLVCVEPVYTKEQSSIARYLISKDRGQNVRTVESYEKLASRSFTIIHSEIHHDLLRIPYTQILIQCTR
jgi:cyclopropane fatty-acyl-phospholipid synthase-like methyltransferase